MPRESAAIEQITSCPDGTRRILLRLEEPFSFLAGQHLLVCGRDGAKIPFSIASAPRRLPWLELHYYPVTGSEAAASMDRLLESASQLEFEGPYGDIAIAEPSATVLTMIVAGSGAAQAYSIVEHLDGSGQTGTVTLFWHVPSAQALYCNADFHRFARNDWFRYRPIVDRQRSESALAAEQRSAGSIERWLEEEAAAIEGAELILCGSPDFVYRVTDAIAELGLQPARIRSDVFSYAPRQGR